MAIVTRVTAAERRARRLSEETLRAATRSFREEGVCVLEGALPTDGLRSGAREASALLDRYLRRAARRGGIGLGMDRGFAEIVQRAPGRFDLLWGANPAAFSDPALLGPAIWSDLIAALLGDDHRTLFRGLLMTLPHASEQPWHTDGEHLFPGDGPLLPAHCLNVFVPLVDVHADNGPTEFCPGSHKLTKTIVRAFEQDRDLPERVGFSGTPVTPEIRRGSIVVFDYRIVHRGLGNRSAAARPVLYFTYAAPWFSDVRNFPERALNGRAA